MRASEAIVPVLLIYLQNDSFFIGKIVSLNLNTILQRLTDIFAKKTVIDTGVKKFGIWGLKTF